MSKKVEVQPVQGFKVGTFTVKKDKVELRLLADKEDISAGEYDLGEVLGMLELHSTSDYEVELSLVTKELSKQ